MADHFLAKLDARIKAINLPMKVLSDVSGIGIKTLYSMRKKYYGAPSARTRTRLMDALIAEEIRLRDYLNRLHPTPLPDEHEVR